MMLQYLRLFASSLFIIFVTVASSCEGSSKIKPYVRNQQVLPSVWNSLTPYFLPIDHPIKSKLDKLFRYALPIRNTTSLERAGFTNNTPQQWTRVIVTTHLKFPGYYFKLYLDSQHYHLDRPEHHFWVLRIKGANLIREEIAKRNLQHLFKVPQKWIYPLPDVPRKSGKYPLKHFILVEEDMDICDKDENALQWSTNPIINYDTLRILCNFLNDLGLKDCAKIDNIPFAKDGKIAFVDTQSFWQWPVLHHKLLPALNPDMQLFWQLLTGGS